MMRISLGLFSLFVGLVGYVVVGSVACDPPPPKEEPKKEQPGEKPTPKDDAEKAADGGGKDEGKPDVVADSGEPIKDEGQPDTGPQDIAVPEPNPNVGKIRWSASTGGAIRSIALSSDEKTIYVAANSLTAYGATDGKEQWSLTSLGGSLSPPVVGTDGKIFVGSSDKKFFAINADGQRVAWSVVLQEGANLFAPAMNKDGSVIYVVSGNTLYAFKTSAGGEKAWANQYVLSAGIVSAPSVGADGTIYVCGKDKSLHAVKPDGTLKWEKSIGARDGDLCRAPAIDVDGTLYVGGDKLYAFKPDGEIKWSRPDYGNVTTSVVIHETFLYFATFSGKLYKVNKSDGTAANILWESGITLSVTSDQQAPPTIGAGGIIYIGVGGARPSFKFLSPANGKGLQTISASRHAFIDSAAIAKDGTLYVGNSEGTVFAIWTNSLGLANSPWPRATHDNQNRGVFK